MELKTKSTVKGGEFIIKDSKPEDIFTPEDFSQEHIMMKESVQEFIDREIWPYKERFEKKDYEFTKQCMQKAGELGFSRGFSSRKLWRNGNGFCIHDVGL